MSDLSNLLPILWGGFCTTLAIFGLTLLFSIPLGLLIAVQNGSTAQKLLDASEAGKAAKEIVPFDDNQTALMDLDKGGVDAVFLDEIVAKYWIVTNAKDYTVLEEGLSDEVYAVGFRKKDQALRDAVNSTLAAMKADGKFDEISAKWFGK